ncbi:putative transporter [Baekduia alba]|uniref:MFS transporter n=1 Tax=Baekduia alba TaxID=2997333 RepID=UPI002341B25F|nr:MFS transporter [Baekduia alba]WCB91511.1 putative transporter [Baekduia alba]
MPPPTLKTTAPPPTLSRALILLLAVTCGLAVGNAYAAQPLLADLAAAFAIDPAAAGAVVTVTQLGLATGLVLVVPLGDLLDRRRLIVAQLGAGATALLLVACATSRPVLLAAMALVGLSSVVTQVIVAHVATLSSPEHRGRAVGTVTGGVVTGILLSRTAAGALGALAGWRSVYLASALTTLVVAGLLLRALPRMPRHEAAAAAGTAARPSYLGLLRSTFALFARMPLLRVRGALALLAFAVFSTLWTGLALALADGPHHLSSGAIGLFGLAGAAGAVAAVRAGRLADRGHGRATTGAALALLVASWPLIALLDASLVALAAGIVVLDLAVQAVHVTSLSLLVDAAPLARSRVTAAYMVCYSAGSAGGSLAATELYATAGWTAVCVQGAALSLGALALWASPPRRERGGGASLTPGLTAGYGRRRPAGSRWCLRRSASAWRRASSARPGTR